MSDQPEYWSVLFTMKDSRQFQYDVADHDAVLKLIQAVSNYANRGNSIAVFNYGKDGQGVGCIQVDEVLSAKTLWGTPS